MGLQCQCLKIPVLEGQAPRVRSWVAGLSTRADEVLGALESEGIHDEAVFLAQEGGVEYLYLYSRAEDLEAAGRAFEQSTLAVDLEFKQLLSELLDFSQAVTLPLVFCADRPEQWVNVGDTADSSTT